MRDHLEADHLLEVRPAVLHSGRRQQRHHAAGGVRPAGLSAAPRPTRSIAGSSRTSSPRASATPASTLFRGCRVQDVKLDAGGHNGHVHPGRASTTRARWVVDASGRSTCSKSKLGLGTRRGHDQLGLVPARRRARPRGLGRRRGLDDHVLKPGVRMSQHQPSARRGLLGLADPALLGPDLIGVCADPRHHPFERDQRAGPA